MKRGRRPCRDCAQQLRRPTGGFEKSRPWPFSDRLAAVLIGDLGGLIPGNGCVAELGLVEVHSPHQGRGRDQNCRPFRLPPRVGLIAQPGSPPDHLVVQKPGIRVDRSPTPFPSKLQRKLTIEPSPGCSGRPTSCRARMPSAAVLELWSPCTIDELPPAPLWGVIGGALRYMIRGGAVAQRPCRWYSWAGDPADIGAAPVPRHASGLHAGRPTLRFFR